MVYVIMLTVGFETILQGAFLAWLTWKMWKAENQNHYPLLTALPTAPEWVPRTPKHERDGEGEVELIRAF